MRIVDTRQSLSTLVVVLVVLFLFGLAEDWIGGFIAAGVLAWLIKNDKRRT